METLTFKKDRSGLVLNVPFWLRNGSRGPEKTGGSPAELRTILDRYVKDGFFVDAKQWIAFCAAVKKCAEIDGKGSQAAEKAAIIDCYEIGGKAGFVEIFKTKKTEGKKAMKKVEMQIMTSKGIQTVAAVLDTETGIAYHKNGSGEFVASDYATGLMIKTGKTRKAAAAAVAEVMEAVERVRNSGKYAGQILNGEKAADPVPAVAEEKQPEPAAIETTPEEIKKSVLDEIRGGDFSGILAMLGSNRGNNAAIIRAGIAAGVFKPAEMERFVLSGIMPDYHTFDAWKQSGYMVRKGEKCAFKAVIWKYTDKNPDTEEETENTELKPGPDFIHKIAYMFGADQVDKIERKEIQLPDGCKREKIGSREYITGNTKPHKEALKAAGYRWNKTRAAWYR